VRPGPGPRGFGVDLDELHVLGAGFIKRDPARQRTGHRRKIQLHGPLPFLHVSSLIFVPSRINYSRSRIFCEMVQKKWKNDAPAAQEGPGRTRGGPRQYDPELALAKAAAAFWKHGYAATSLDDLAAATGMNRPSLYAAFGDKRDLY